MREAMFERIVEHGHQLLFIVNEQGAISYASPALCSWVGRKETSIKEAGIERLIAAADLDLFKVTLAALKRDDLDYENLEMQLIGSDGTSRWVAGVAVADYDSPEISGVLVSVFDIDSRRRFERQLLTKTFYDETGMASRALFLDRLEQLLERSPDEMVAKALLVRIDDFEGFVNSLGWLRSEELAQAASQRVLESIGGRPLSCRFHADTFAIADAAAVSNRGEMILKIRNGFSKPLVVGTEEIDVSVSIGLASGAVRGLTTELMLARADVASREADQGHAVAWTPDMSSRVSHREATRADLELALERDELRLEFQPIMEVSSGEACGIEALCRWEHPERGLVPPSEFIAVADESNMIDQIGIWVLHQGLHSLAALNAYRRNNPLRLTVNVSQRQLVNPDFMSELRMLLNQSGVAPSLLSIDLTEATLGSRHSLVGAVLSDLRKLGVSVAIDDFGTGYSSLASLKDAPATHIKIDRQFTNLLSSERPGVVAGLIHLAHEMGFGTIAEGVETAEQFEHLRQLGCEFSQGWYHGRPAPLQQVADQILIGK